ncbi:MAG: ubiquitin-like domain-containing protein [Candidatus Hodarchaeales archaeon]
MSHIQSTRSQINPTEMLLAKNLENFKTNIDALTDLMVNSESNFNENPMKKFTFRLTGVPPDQAIKSIDIEIARKTVKGLKMEVQAEYELNPILNIHLVLNGEVLSDNIPLAKLRLRPKDTLTVIASQAAAGSEFNNRRAMLEKYIKDGTSEQELIKIYGNEIILKSEYRDLFGVETYEKVVYSIFEDLIENGLKTIKGWDQLTSNVVHLIKSIRQVIPALALETRRGVIQGYCLIRYGVSYDQLLMQTSRYTGITYTDALKLADKVNQMFKNSINDVRQLLGIVESHIWSDAGSHKDNVIWMKFGNHKEYVNSEGLQTEGKGFVHIIQEHLDDFRNVFGKGSASKIVSFIFNTITATEGAYTYMKSGQIAFKVFSQKTGRYEYLLIGLDPDGSIHSAYPADDTNRIKISRTLRNKYNKFFL